MKNIISALERADSFLSGFEDVDNAEDRETVAEILAEVRAAIAEAKMTPGEAARGGMTPEQIAEELKRNVLAALLEVDNHWNELHPDTDLYNAGFPFDTDLHEVTAAVATWAKAHHDKSRRWP